MRTRWPRTIVHADMDAFYAAVEQLDDPTLRGKPLLVGPRSARGVVLTASYEARPFGVGSAMPMIQARRLCPEALIIPPRFARYQAVSEIVMKVFATFSPIVEPLSLDEAFLDMTGAEKIFGAAERIGRRIKDAVYAATGGLTVSVGISATKYVAKVASGHQKPDGLTIVPPDCAREWLEPMSVSRLWGAGVKTVARLNGLGFRTIGDVAAADPDRLANTLGSTGRHLRALARAEDPRPVDGAREARSIGSELTLNTDVTDRREMEFHLRRCADKVARRLRRASSTARGVRLKLKRHDFRLLTRQRSVAEPTDVADELFRAACSLLDSMGTIGPVRLIGLAAFDLVQGGADRSSQGDLLAGSGRARKLEVALDALAERYGQGVVSRASELIRDRGVGLSADLDFLRNRRNDEKP